MVLNKEDKDFIKELFDSLDSNKDGKLSKEEITQGFYKLKIPSAEKDVQSFLNHVDSNHDGQISYQEFEQFTNNNLKKLKDVFDSLDTNKNGTLDLFEIQESIKKLNLTVYSEQEVSRLFNRIDKNKDNAIDFNEWRELLVLLPNTGMQHILAFWKDTQILDASFDGGGALPPMVETKDKKSALMNTISYMIAGSIAGAVSRTSTAPLERVKIMYQLNHKHSMSFLQTCKAVYADGGFKGLFRGNLANILKVSPESAVKFATYEYVKRLFANTDSELTSPQRFVSGAVAGIVSHTSLFPLECVRMRLSAEPAGTYKGIFDCFKKVAQSERSIKPFYRGLTASIVSTIPHSGINMMVYEFLKIQMLTRKNNADLSSLEILLCASLSSVAGQIVGYPFHVIKCRLITGGTVANPEKYNGLFDGMKKIVKNEGPRGLYKGIMPNFAKAIPSHGLTFITYEFFKKAFDINLEKEKKHHK